MRGVMSLTRILAVVFAAAIGCGPSSRTTPFCAEWAGLSDEVRRTRVYALADDYLATLSKPEVADSVRQCVRERTDGFLRDRGQYYVCKSGDDFTAGKILGQAQSTSVAICLHELRSGQPTR